VGAVSGGAACGRVRFDAVYEKEMMQPLDNKSCARTRVASSRVF
jgi:hypothetical protein